MASPLELASYVQHQGELGRQRGTQNRLASLASQAYGAPEPERRGLVQQAIGADPTAGFALGQSLEQDRGQQMGSLSQKARMLVGYAKAGNQQGVQSLYPQLAAEAQQLGLGQGIPQQWDESFLPGIEQLAQMGGAGDSGNTIHSQRVLADGRIMNTYRDGRTEITDHQADVQAWMRDHPGMDPHIVRRSGEVVPVGNQLQTGAHVVPQGQGQQFVEQSLQLANQMIAAGIPEQQVDAFLQARMNPQGQPAPQGAPQAGGQAPQGPTMPAPAMGAPQGAGVPARPSEAQVAAEQEAARRGVGLQFAPAEAQAAANQASLIEQAKSAAARVAESAERTISADDALDLLDRAESLIPISTGSGVGALADRALGFVGLSDQGAQAADALKTIAGQLVAKMPRFEGPQSDRDVQLYMDMAGNLADASIPRERRLAALQTVRELQARYASSQPSPRPQSPPAGGQAQRARNPQTGEVLELRNGQWVPVNE